MLGSLIEKQRTTPDAYPLSLNALRLACNQSTNRDPVVEYDDATIRAALDRLGRRRWARLASGRGSRAPKFRHLLDEALALDDSELSLLAVLMLRGPQTAGELKARSERLHAFADTASVEARLERLAERDLAERLSRRPGQKEERWVQRLAGDEDDASPEAAPRGLETDAMAADEKPAPDDRAEDAEDRAEAPEHRVGALEHRVGALEAEIRALQDAVGELRRRSA